MEDGMMFDEVELNFILEALTAYKDTAKQRCTDAAAAHMTEHTLTVMKEIEDRILEYLG